MRKILHLIFALVIILNISASHIVCYGEGLSVSAHSAVLIEMTTGRVLYSKNSDKRLPMASTTKIMTTICAIENNNEGMDKIIEVSETAAGVEGSSMYLQKGEKMSFKELLYGLMLSSGNDAAVAIAEAVSGSCEKFADLMNKKAVEMGVLNTHFTNPSGLPDENHFSTAEDMAIITAYALSNPEFYEIVSSKSYKIEGEGKAYPRTLSNHNKLLSMYEGCIGVKTGFTKAAGRCLVSAAKRGEMTLIAVTLNAPNDWSDHAAMLDFGFDNYKYTTLASDTVPVTSVEVNSSYKGVVPVYPERAICYPLAKGEEFVLETELYPGISAPLKKGERVGKIAFYIKGGELQSTELVSGEDVALVIQEDVKSTNTVRDFGKSLIKNIGKAFAKWAGFIVGREDC